MPLFLLSLASAHALTLDEADVTIYGNSDRGAFAGDDAAVGDLNGDGVDDFAVANPSFGSWTGPGRVYVYLGGDAGPTLQTILQGTDDSALGVDVAAGDVNGDGYDDLLVGIYDGDRGAVELYLGSADGLETTASATWTGETGGSIGIGLTVVDVDLDGYGDAVFCDTAQVEVQIHRGRRSVPSARIDYRLEAPGFDDFAGYVLPADVNGDGHPDLVASGPTYMGGYRGSVHVFESASGGPSSTPDTSILGYDGFVSYPHWFGYRMASADTDGDGYEDLIVGAAADTASDGRVYVFRGSNTGLQTVPSATFEADAVIDEFGGAVGAGDLDGDGFGDVVVGAPDGETSAVYTFLGSSSGISTTATNVITEGPPSDNLGIALAVADVDGDGRDDVLVGDNESYGAAVLRLYRGIADGLSSESLVIDSPDPYVPDFGASISAAGDVNGDGFADILISSSTFADDSGIFFLYLGGPGGMSTVPALTFEGRIPGDRLGFDTAAAGDVDGDGLDDIVVGTYEGNKALVYYGNATYGLARVPTVLTGPADAYFGMAVGPAGDVNGDGFDDVAVGARGGVDEDGAVYVYLGTATGIETTATVLALPRRSMAEELGTDVDSAGDVDGDGYDDLVVGSYGSAFVFLGGPSGIDRVADTELEALPGTLNPFTYGYQVAGAGDANGDGYDDVFFNAWGADRAYLALGSSSGMADTPDTIFTEDHPDFAYDIDGGFDFDADGYSDLLADAYLYSPDPGRAYLYMGGASGPSMVATGTIVGLDSEDFEDVAALGDVNGDGYDDVAIGTDSGAVRIYYGRLRDDDGDGFSSLDDCDDLDAAVHPGAFEVVGDEIDENCDGGERCFVDADGDGCRTTASVR
jgi:hypothetical protein